MIELLAREDAELIGLLGGRRREALGRAHREGQLVRTGARASAICVHDRLFPRRLRAPGAPRLLYTEGDDSLLQQGDRRPVVTVLGTQRPSEYGVEMAHALSHSLARSGVLVVTLKAEGIARTVRAGVEQAGRGAVILSGNGLELARAVVARPAATRAHRRSCLAGELPPGCSGRRWGRLAAERTAVALSDLVLVVEARASRELFGVELARTDGVPVAAVPGKVTSPLAQGPLELLTDGAALVRCAEDVLELVGYSESRPPRPVRGDELPLDLARVLERIGSGQETPEQLLAAGADRNELMLALAQLELTGRIRRGPHGRYIATALGVTRIHGDT
jgi:DNA processing protein